MIRFDSTTVLATLIKTELEISGLEAGEYPVTAFAAYLELLTRWSKAYNLTGIRDHKKMITHHILDSLSVLPYLHGSHCVDVGTGAGLPGIILALARPEQQWYLLDSNRKKIRFVDQAILELHIPNVETVWSRVEDYNTNRQFTTVITRAFGSLKLTLDRTSHLLTSATSLLVMKGEDVMQELQELDKATIQVQVHNLRVTGLSRQRSLVEIRPLPVSG